MSGNHTAVILEAVALVLRDLKTELEDRIGAISEASSARERAFDERLAMALHAMTAARTGMASNHEKITSISHRVQTIEDEEPINLEPIHSALTALQEGRDTADDRIDSVLEDARKAKIEISRLGEVVDVFRSGQEARDSEKEELLKAADESKAELVRELSAIVERLQNAEQKIVSADEVIEQLHDQHAKTQAVLAGLAEGIDEASKEKESLAGRMTGIDRTLEQLAETTDGANGQIGGLDERIRTLEARAIEELDSLTKVVTAYVARIESLEMATNVGEERIAEIKSHEATLADQLAAISESQDRQTEELRQELQGAIDAKARASDQMLVEQAHKFIAKLAENIRGERGPAGYLSRVQRWVADYEFPERALVLHHAGLWQALRETSQEPHAGKDSDWLSLAAGIESIHVAEGSDRPEEYVLSFRDSTGREHAIGIQVPLPKFHKTWEKERAYQHYDSVMEDGHRWLAITDNPGGPPSRSEDWILLGMRGPRGARGIKGDRGLPGVSPGLDSIVEAYVRKMEDGPGTPIFRYRGGWRYGTDYASGDLVQGNRALVLCIEKHRAEKAPFSPGQQQWVSLFSASDDPSQEASENLGHRLDAQEREIASLKQQIEDLSA